MLVSSPPRCLLEFCLKPRVKHGMSSLPRELGGRKNGVFANSGFSLSQKSIAVMPLALEHARAQAVCPRAMTGSSLRASRAGMYGIDKASVYCLSQVLRVGYYYTVWPDVDGCCVRPHVTMRMLFGGGSWPNRFELISLLDSACVQRCERELDKVNPLPTEAHRWPGAEAAGSTTTTARAAGWRGAGLPGRDGAVY